jgi:hypothetical protein
MSRLCVRNFGSMNGRWKRVDLSALFTGPQLTAICSSQQPGRQHPLGYLLTKPDPDPVEATTENAFRLLLTEDRNWLVGLRARLSNLHDYSDASSALAEIRAYAALKHAFRNVAAIATSRSRRTADFCVTLRAGQTVYVEVQAKQWDQKEAAALGNFYATPPPPPPQRPGVSSKSHVAAPFGPAAYKSTLGHYERVTEQVVSRVCAIKSADAQLSRKSPSILWLDFQDQIWEPLHLQDHIYPVISWNGAITSGGFWNGFYGRKGLPLFENATIGLGLIGDVVRMQHDGRFFIRAGLMRRFANPATGIALSLPTQTVLFENPVGRLRLPDEFVLAAFEFPWFRIEHCWLEWPDRNLLHRVRKEHRVVRRIQHRARRVLQGSLAKRVRHKARDFLIKIRIWPKRK